MAVDTHVDGTTVIEVKAIFPDQWRGGVVMTSAAASQALDGMRDQLGMPAEHSA
jgi:hypothetical protein